MWLVGSVEETWEGWLGAQGQKLKCWRDILVAGGGGVPLRSVGSKPQLGSPAYSTRARKEPR